MTPPTRNKRGRKLSQKKIRKYLPSIMEDTRRSRIQAEKRLLLYDSLSKIANVSFACWTAVVSLLSLVYPKLEGLTFTAVCTSVTLAIISAYTSSKDYALRAEKMRLNYLSIHRLILEFDNAKQTSSATALSVDGFSRRYSDLLETSENHATIDYCIAKLEQGSDWIKPKDSPENNENEAGSKSRRRIKRLSAAFHTIAKAFVRFWRCARSIILKIIIALLPLAVIAVALTAYRMFGYGIC